MISSSQQNMCEYDDSNYEIERRLNIDDEFSGPVKERSCTDVPFLYIKVAFVIGLFGLVGYCMANGDLNRLINGYDNCGNVCGQINTPSKEPGFCKGGDFTDKKYLRYEIKADVFDEMDTTINLLRECATSCSAGYVEVGNECFPDNMDKVFKEAVTYIEEVAEDIEHIWPYLVYLCLIAFGLSLFFLLMFRFAAAVMVWVTLGLMMIITTSLVIFLWVQYSQVDSKAVNAEFFLFGAIMMTIIAVVALLVILVMRKRIQLVIQLFEEAARAAVDMPLIFIQPVLTFLVLCVVCFLWFYFAIYIESAGILTPVTVGDKPSDMSFNYVGNTVMELSQWYNLFAAFWMSQFVIGCQHMVLASAVSTWYFSRDKSRLGSPLLTGFKNLVRYHLGSVIFASLIMAIIAIIKFLLKLTESTFKRSNHVVMRIAYYCIRCFTSLIERIFNMISRNAYVEIAIYGKGFCPSAVRGLKMLFNNLFSAAAINSVGDFVLLINKLLIVIITLSISSFMFWNKDNVQHPEIPIILSVLFTLFIAHTFISVFEMTIDTIFICFCEDCEMNDGINKPYYMNRGLMEFVENSKKVLKIKDKNETCQPSAPPIVFAWRIPSIVQCT